MTHYHLAPGVLRADLEDEEVLLNPATGIYHLLNPTGSVLLASLEQGSSLDEAVSRLAEEFGEPESRVRGDAERFLADLVVRRLIVEQR
jgi:PqqD family protein of HPr-rel-A system